jgi:hypothetical protein
MNVNGYTSKAQALRALANAGYRMASALSKPVSNPKVAKNQKIGVLASPLHLAPASLSGFNVCPQASKGCIAACLHTAGNPAHMSGKHASRVTKTKAYMNRSTRGAFVALIAFEIAALVRAAKTQNMEAGVRLNATSDIAWERVDVHVDGYRHVNLMQAFSDVQFYDYTKVTKRALAAQGDSWPANYHLTFSKAEDNDSDVIRVLKAGGNVAIVFDHRKAHPMPEFMQLSQGALVPSPQDVADWMVVDGDEHDFRPADGSGVIVGLKAKGDARGDESGFVMRFVA